METKKTAIDSQDSPGASRRDALALFLTAGATAGAAMPALAQNAAPTAPRPALRQKPFLGLVSRHLQWTEAEHGIEVAKAAGFPAILWTVRGGAHIEPKDVEKELPRIVKLTRDAGMDVPMIITAIGDTSSDHAEAILATMQGLGIHLYRAGAPGYNYDAPFPPQYSSF